MQHSSKNKGSLFRYTFFDVSYVVVRAYRDPGSSRVQASCLHKSASIPEKSEGGKVLSYWQQSHIVFCINYQKQKTRGLK